ncbi:predicted protein [Naegleria gruberi]|uniref:Predicted protein n=1 Tax=Naegleria gruberi TaxID=5762 RepID=D2UZ54_NAEGR|nr:uncharacterized protein NAEGRDRAFT_45397 [Naegleria gruberi]EFC50094.1 predicted protein [Naegleria gruberi]|eukprot:XP_002682838.1 predicted protein [Naegleria gruberi strain NEG-M]
MPPHNSSRRDSITSNRGSPMRPTVSLSPRLSIPSAHTIQIPYDPNETYNVVHIPTQIALSPRSDHSLRNSLHASTLRASMNNNNNTLRSSMNGTNTLRTSMQGGNTMLSRSMDLQQQQPISYVSSNNNVILTSRMDTNTFRRNSGTSEDEVIYVDKPLVMTTTTTTTNTPSLILSPNSVSVGNVSDFSGERQVRRVTFDQMAQQQQQVQLSGPMRPNHRLDRTNNTASTLNMRIRGLEADYMEDVRRRNREVYGNQYQIWRNYKEKTKSTMNVHDAMKSKSNSVKNFLHINNHRMDPMTIQELRDQGYIVKMTPKGQPYIVRDKALTAVVSNNNIQPVKEEKEEKKLSFFCRWSAIEDAYGLGVKLYFDFARLMIVLNAFLFCIQLFNIIVHLVVDYQDIANSFSSFDLSIIDQLYASTYSRSLYWVWISTNALCIVISLAFGPLYWWIIHTYYEKRDLYDCEENFLDSESDKIKENQKIRLLEYLFRMILSYSVFAIFMMISFSVTMGFTILQNVNAMYELADSTFSANGNILTAISIGISVVISVMSFIWKKICAYLTNFGMLVNYFIDSNIYFSERHKTWSSYRKHNTFKFLFFKLFSVFVMGFTKGFFATPCVIKVMGNQYMIQMFIDFSMAFLVELVFPLIARKVKELVKKDDTPVPKPDFDVSEEYLELIYRQYLVYNGFVSFPLITLIGLVASIFEVYLDKFRLLKIAAKPPLTTGSVKSVVTFFAILAAILPIFNWAGGNLYILSGYYWCNAPSDIECSACTITDNGRFPNLIKAMFEST